MIAAAIQGLGGTCFLLVSVAVGVRLVLLARRNRTLPELLLGVSFLAGAGIGATLEAGALVASQQINPATAGAVLAVAKVFGTLGMAAHVCFTWRVFRPNEAWALGIVAAVGLLLCVANAGYFVSGSFATANTLNGWFWLELAARVTSPTWLAIESFRYYGLMQRRVQLGLAEPIVANRFWLWGVGSSMGILVLGTSIPPMFVANDVSSIWMQIDLVVFGFAGAAACIPYFLAFFPPDAYARYVNDRAGAASAS